MRIALIVCVGSGVLLWAGAARGGGDANCDGRISAADLSALITLVATDTEAPCGGLTATGHMASAVFGDDGSTRTGTPLAYRDNGDGTITDINSGLMWEKKVKLDSTRDAADLHDADDCYPWRGACSAGGAVCGTEVDCPTGEVCVTGDCQMGSPGGLTVYQWLAQLNAQRFAGYDDWRLPNLRELLSLADYGRVTPAIDPSFHGARCGGDCADLADPACSCTISSRSYWSSTSLATGPVAPWSIDFFYGIPQVQAPTLSNHVRAVRGGQHPQISLIAADP